MKRFTKGLVLVAILTLMVSLPVSAKTKNFVSVSAETSYNTGDTNEEDDIIPVRSSSQSINGITFSVSFSRHSNVDPSVDKQIEILEDVFYQVYPQMYDRFGGYSKAATNVAVTFEHDYMYAGSALRDTIVLNDKYCNPWGYMVFVHELAHVIQHKWNPNTQVYDHWNKSRLEDDEFVENFAEYCAYVYAYENGKYHDIDVGILNIYQEGTLESSDRFLLWLDWETTSSNKDIIRDFFEVCNDEKYSRDQWHDKVWPMLFKGTRFEGRSIDDVWKEYRNGDFSHYGTTSTNGYTPEIIRKCRKGGEDIRTYLKKHSFSQRYEEGL